MAIDAYLNRRILRVEAVHLDGGTDGSRAFEILGQVEAEALARLVGPTDAPIVEQGKAPDVLGGVFSLHVLGALADDDGQLTLVVEQRGPIGDRHLVLRSRGQGEVLPEAARPAALAGLGDDVFGTEGLAGLGQA